MRSFVFLTLLIFLLSSCENTKTQKTSSKLASSPWCSDAHKDLAKMMTALKETVPKGEKDSIRIPDQKAYISQCSKLPEQAQQCLVVEYAMKHTKTCQNLTLKGEDKTTFEKLVSGK